MQPFRPSILTRPVRDESRIHETTTDSQYQQEQEKLKLKAAKASATNDRIQRALYPTAEDKAAAYYENQQQVAAHTIAKLREREAEAAHESRWNARDKEVRPWLNESRMCRDQVTEEEARRARAIEASAVNRAMIEEAALRRSWEQQQQAALEKEVLQTQSFWNESPRGETRKGKAVMAERGVIKPAPWAADDDVAPPRQQRQQQLQNYPRNVPVSADPPAPYAPTYEDRGTESSVVDVGFGEPAVREYESYATYAGQRYASRPDSARSCNRPPWATDDDVPATRSSRTSANGSVVDYTRQPVASQPGVLAVDRPAAGARIDSSNRGIGKRMVNNSNSSMKELLGGGAAGQQAVKTNQPWQPKSQQSSCPWATN